MEEQEYTVTLRESQWAEVLQALEGLPYRVALPLIIQITNAMDPRSTQDRWYK